MAEIISKPSPGVVLDLIMGFRRSKTMFAAVSLGIFDELASGQKSCEVLARSLQLNPDALERILDACVGLQLLKHEDGHYENTSVSMTYLWSKSPQRLTGYINTSNDIFWKLWEHLEGAIREGTHRWKETFDWDEPYWNLIFKSHEAKEEFLMGMHGFGQITSPNLVRAFDLNPYGKLVDLGGGTGHVAIAFCERYPEKSATVFEVPDAAPLAKKTIKEAGLESKIKLKVGDFFKDSLPQGDLYCLARIIHDWPESRVIELLQKVFDTLKPTGALLIAEKLLNDDKSGPYWAQMQNLNMLVLAEGKERTFGEYKALLQRVGFTQVSAAVTDSPLDFILAVKEGETEHDPLRKPRAIDPPAFIQLKPRAEFPYEAELYYRFIEEADIGFVIAKWDGDFLLVNRAFAMILGYDVRELSAMNYRNITPEGYEEEDQRQIKLLDEQGDFGPFEKQYIRKDETLISVRVTLKKIFHAGEKCIWASVQKVGDQAGINAKGGRVVAYKR